jgi:hypothetical protein
MSAKNAAEQIKNFGSKLKGFLEAAEFLEKIGNIENYESEVMARKNAAIKAEAEAVAALCKAEEDLSFALEKVKAAEDMAKSILSEADKKAADRKQFAESELEKVILDGGVKIKKVEADIKERLLMSKEIDGQIAEKAAELSAIKKNIEEAKAKIASL